ncbi:hypothetical protein EHQ52_10510 [Leptospira koniambonensis]|uniref:Transposase n=1 Tax=Leptospira koniambonensis TaxID=2484950 RepID=A0A4R9JAE9_9LEPT|nr:hypothetical protein [Leptospira koniambonensis]TGL34912.1 hypothetical protein EHQ52_10510 [Leptospira koniambonensis]
MSGLDSVGTMEPSSDYLIQESISYPSKEAPILSLKGVTLTPVCICPECGVISKTPWYKSRGRLRDWAAFLEEVRYITCSNESCQTKYPPKYLLDFSKGISILNKSNLLNSLKSWFEEFAGREIVWVEEEESGFLYWDPFFQSVPNWADHIPAHLFANILRYTPPKDLEGILLGRKGIPMFGGFKF